MEIGQFEQRLATLGAATSRRQIGVSLLRVAAGAMAVSLLEACGAKKKPAAKPSPSACTTPSTCATRQYCDPNNLCVCLRSAEGDIKCGALPPSCDMPLCSTSTDCAFLGEGYFCDSPNSGCCDDAEKARCIPPCATPPVAKVDFDTCTSCKVYAPHLPPSPDVQARIDVTACDTCATKELIDGANNDPAYGRLNASLLLQGFADRRRLEKYSQVNGADTVRQGLFRTFTSTDGSLSAVLVYGMEAAGGQGSFALVLRDGKVIYGLGIDNNSLIYKQLPDPAGFSPPGMDNMPAMMGRDLTLLGASQALRDDNSCGMICNFLVSFMAGGAACGVACFFACAFTGPGVLLCAVTLGVTCSVLAWAAGVTVCDQNLCHPKANIYCACNNKCYSDASTCTSECQGSMDCFSGICQPNDEKCPTGGAK